MAVPPTSPRPPASADSEREAEIRAQMRAQSERRAESGTEPGPSALDASIYSGSERYRLELERVFRRSWHAVARAAELAEPGSFATAEIAGDHVAVLRGEDGALRALHDVCRHRGAVILRAPRGQVDRLRCPFHGFTYGLDGRLQSLPEPGSFARDPRSDRSCSLPPVELELWGGWAWVRLEPGGAPLAEALGEGLLAELAPWPLAEATVVARESRSVACGWKIGVEAFLEAWHLPAIHARSANPLVDYRAASFATFGDHSRMINAFRSEQAYEPAGPLGSAALAAGVPNFPGLRALQRSSNSSYLVFPNMIFNLLPNHFTVFWVQPEAPGRARFVYELYALAPEPAQAALAERYFAELDLGYKKLIDEDLENLPWIQRGVEDSSFTAVRPSRYEQRIAHFHARLREHLSGREL